MTGLILALLAAIAVHGQPNTGQAKAGAAGERVQALVAAIESGDGQRSAGL